MVVIKWYDKCKVFTLSTKHTNKIISVTARNGNEEQKFKADGL